MRDGERENVMDEKDREGGGGGKSERERERERVRDRATLRQETFDKANSKGKNEMICLSYTSLNQCTC